MEPCSSPCLHGAPQLLQGSDPRGSRPVGTQTPQQPHIPASQLAGGMWPRGRGRTARDSGGGCGSWSGRWSRHRMTKETCTKVRERQDATKLTPALPSAHFSQPHATPVLASPAPTPASSAQSTGGASPGCRSPGRAASSSARARAGVSRGENLSQRFAVFATCKTPGSFSLSHAQRRS